MTEYYFWKKTEMKIATVSDILNGNIVRKIMSMLRNKDDEQYLIWRKAVEEKKVTLDRLQEEASENADILRTYRTFFEVWLH
jgi:hypothetical protein